MRQPFPARRPRADRPRDGLDLTIQAGLEIEEAERGELTEPPWCFCKTQFGSVTGHVAVVELLAAIRKEFLPNLEVSDEGGYWETRDVAEVARKKSFLDRAIGRSSRGSRAGRRHRSGRGRHGVLPGSEIAARPCSGDAGNGQHSKRQSIRKHERILLGTRSLLTQAACLGRCPETCRNILKIKA